MMAANLKLDNLLILVDFNDFGGMDRMSEGHQAFAPLKEKFEAFGFEAMTADGHDVGELANSFMALSTSLPKVIVCETVKGKGSIHGKRTNWLRSKPE